MRVTTSQHLNFPAYLITCGWIHCVGLIANHPDHFTLTAGILCAVSGRCGNRAVFRRSRLGGAQRSTAAQQRNALYDPILFLQSYGAPAYLSPGPGLGPRGVVVSVRRTQRPTLRRRQPRKPSGLAIAVGTGSLCMFSPSVELRSCLWPARSAFPFFPDASPILQPPPGPVYAITSQSPHSRVSVLESRHPEQQQLRTYFSSFQLK